MRGCSSAAAFPKDRVLGFYESNGEDRRASAPGVPARLNGAKMRALICIKVRRCVTPMEADVPDYTPKPLSS